MASLTLKSKEMVSIDITDFLAKFCNVPVKKACGKKKPLIQKTGGIPFAIHLCKKSMRRSRSFTQEAKGFRDG